MAFQDTLRRIIRMTGQEVRARGPLGLSRGEYEEAVKEIEKWCATQGRPVLHGVADDGTTGPLLAGIVISHE